MLHKHSVSPVRRQIKGVEGKQRTSHPKVSRRNPVGRPEGTLGHSLDNDLRYGGGSKSWIEKVHSRPGWRELFAAGRLHLSVFEA